MAAALLTVLALVPAGLALHKHEADVQAAGHADCDACHLRHLSAIVTGGAPAPPAPGLVTHAVAPPAPNGERGTPIGICPTRGPPV